MRKISLTVVFLWVFTTMCLCQQERQYTFVHYGPEKGLAAFEAKAIAQDEAGYIWVGTITGLQRFDGTRFITFHHSAQDPFSIPENNIIQLFRDSRNNLWVRTQNGHIGIFDTKHFRYKDVPLKPKNPASLLSNKFITEDKDGHIFFVLFRSEILAYDAKSNSFIPAGPLIPIDPKWRITFFMQQLPGGKYYIGTDSGMVVFNPRTKNLSYQAHNVEHEPLIDRFGQLRFVGPMLLDSKHRIWLMSWPHTSGVPFFYCFDLIKNAVVLKDYTLYPLIKGYHEPAGMIEQKNGTIWVRGSMVLARYLEKENTFQLVHNGYVNDQSIAFEQVHDMKEDREENLWVATNNNGLYRFNPSMEYFQNIPHINRILKTQGQGTPLCFARDKDGTVLMGTWGDGTYRYDSSFNNIPLHIKGIPEVNGLLTWCMHESNDGRSIWMGIQPGGLYQYDKAAKTATYYDVPVLEHSTIRQIAEDKNGNLWIGTHSKGLFKCTQTRQGYHFTSDVQKITAVDAGMINALCTDPRGNLWVGTASNGAYVIDVSSNRVLQHFTNNGPATQKLIQQDVTALFVYNDSTMVIGDGGLQLYNPFTQKIHKLFWPVSLPPEIRSIQKDRNGYLWISLTAGICRLNISKDRIYIHFDRIDGITNDNFMIGASLQLPDGRMVFGSSNQFIAFDPQKINLNESMPDVTITGIRVRNEALPVDSLLNLKVIELSPDHNAVAIEFSELVYCCGASIIKYKLDGIDKDWIVADNNNQAEYPYLPPGTYTLMAQTQNSEGVPGKNITKIILKVKPHYWQTWWFFGLIVFMALGLFLWVDKLRMQRIIATESMRTRIASSLTEDMGNSLSSINISSELAKTKVDRDTERTREYINQISDSSNRMVQAMYDMVWSINPENDALQHTVERMKSYAAELESQYTPDIVFQVDEDATDIRLRMESRYEMLSIFKEAVNNAARHAHAKYILVNIQYKKPVVTLCIRDDGKGFDVDLVALSRGLQEMRRRANIINASITIQSEINTGTTVKLVISRA